MKKNKMKKTLIVGVMLLALTGGIILCGAGGNIDPPFGLEVTDIQNL